jgi:Adenylate cyclase, family 3 (some proteins contain HAMP domain)
MKESIWQEIISRIQDIIQRETGAPLKSGAVNELENVLAGIPYPDTSVRGEESQSRDVTILLADLRGFTSISEIQPANVTFDLLNRHLVRMSEIIVQHGGTINKFMGDAIMVLFGAPHSHSDDVRRAVTCAVDMQIAMDEINKYHRNLGLPEFYMGIGINTGMVMAGRLGSDLYAEYTVIGDEVNLASRIEAFSLRGQVLISKNTYDRCHDYVEINEPMDVFAKGKSQPVQVYEVLSIPSLHRNLPRKEIRRSHRVEVKIPFTYHLVENKIVLRERHTGTILDISYHGILAELECEHPAYSDIKLDLDLSLIGYLAADIYAKILKIKKQDGRCLASIEFTSVSVQSNMHIQQFVQLLVRSEAIK